MGATICCNHGDNNIGAQTCSTACCPSRPGHSDGLLQLNALENMSGMCCANRMDDTWFTTFKPFNVWGMPLPVLLFQTGYGHSSNGHQPLFQRIANSGFIVIVPDRASDTKGWKKSVDALLGKPSQVMSALSTDGAHLYAALKWIELQDDVEGHQIDFSKIAAGGFGTGAIEVINFATMFTPDIKAVVLISPSTSQSDESLYKFKEEDLLSKVSEWNIPSLWITSEEDYEHEATHKMFAVAACPASLVVFRDATLDLSMELTDETSIWSPAIDIKFPGLAQHFGLASEKKPVSDTPIIRFLDEYVNEEPKVALTIPGDATLVQSK